MIYIDDDATNRAVLCDMIASAGLPITDAADAKTGLQAIKDGEFDLVLMDLRMPEVSGLTAIRQLRSDPGSAAQRLSIMWWWSQPTSRQAFAISAHWPAPTISSKSRST